MRYFLEDLFYYVMGFIMAMTLIAVIVFAFISVKEWSVSVKKAEESTGCEYIGSPKGAHRVGYFDCNGVIETKRIPK
jgi:hypothetical protein